MSAPAVHTVTATIQAPGNAPVEMRYATRVSPVAAIAAVATLLGDLMAGDDVPASIRTTLLSVRVDTFPAPGPHCEHEPSGWECTRYVGCPAWDGDES